MRLRDYAGANGLRWVDDPSNRDIRLDRNFLRHQVLPVLRRRWPVVVGDAGRAARHCAEAALMLEDLAGQDLKHARRAVEGHPAGARAASAAARSGNAMCLRHWLTGKRGTPPSERGALHGS